MNKITEILDKLRQGEPLALTRFNDGEVMAMIDTNAIVARGDQKSSERLKDELIKAIKYRRNNYYIGIPCGICYPDFHNYASDIVGDYKFSTHATVLTNRNWKKFVWDFFNIFSGRRITYVGGSTHNVNELELKFGYKIKHIKTPMKDSFRSLEELKDKKFKKGSIVLLSCGPLSRALVHYWFKNNPDSTFLDVGSVFDPWTRDNWLRCHLGTLPKCGECN